MIANWWSLVNLHTRGGRSLAGGLLLNKGYFVAFSWGLWGILPPHKYDPYSVKDPYPVIFPILLYRGILKVPFYELLTKLMFLPFERLRFHFLYITCIFTNFHAP